MTYFYFYTAHELRMVFTVFFFFFTFLKGCKNQGYVIEVECGLQNLKYLISVNFTECFPTLTLDHRNVWSKRDCRNNQFSNL